MKPTFSFMCVVFACALAFHLEGAEGFQDASECVRADLKSRGLRLGYDAKANRIVTIVNASMKMSVDDLLKGDSFFAKRDALLCQAFSDGAAEIVRCMACDMKRSKREKVESEDILKFAQRPIYGETIISEAESFDGEDCVYEISIAVAWSPEMEKSARDVITRTKSLGKPGSSTLSEWLDHSDLSTMIGPRRMVDSNGVCHFLGISARELNGNPEHDLIMRKAARSVAAGYILRSLHQEVSSSRESSSQEREGKIFERYTSTEECKNRDVSIWGMRNVLSKECVHPMTGKRVYVCVQEVNSTNASDTETLMREWSSNATLAGTMVGAVSRKSAIYTFLGSSAFKWKGGDKDFCAKRNRAFKMAYADALSSAASFADTCFDDCASLFMEMTDFDSSLKVGGEAIKSKCLIEDCEDGSKWGFSMLLSGGASCKNAPLMVRAQTKVRLGVPVITAMKVEQDEAFNPTTSVYSVNVKIGLGDVHKAEDLKGWIEAIDLSVVQGPRMLLDAEGRLWLLGIASGEKGSKVLDRIEKDAFTALCLAVGGEVRGDEESDLKFSMLKGDDTVIGVNFASQLTIGINSSLTQLIRQGKKRKFNCEATHKISGKRMQIVIYAVDLTTLVGK